MDGYFDDLIRRAVEGLRDVNISEEWTPEIQAAENEADLRDRQLRWDIAQAHGQAAAEGFELGGIQFTVRKYVAEIPIATELIFDVVPYSEMSIELRKAWFHLGHGMGRQVLMCEWPHERMTREEYYQQRQVRRQEADLSDCPYYTGTGTCSYGCREEPSCMTDRPLEGWPRER